MFTVIEEVWHSSCIKGTAMHRLVYKLRAAKHALKRWANQIRAEKTGRMNRFLQDLEDVQSKLQTNAIDVDLFSAERLLKEHLKQKSHDLRITLGDSNFKYFYHTMKFRRHRP